MATNLSWRPNNPRAALTRIDGLDRYQVSGDTAYYWEQESADAVVVAGGKAYADALDRRAARRRPRRPGDPHLTDHAARRHPVRHRLDAQARRHRLRRRRHGLGVGGCRQRDALLRLDRGAASAAPTATRSRSTSPKRLDAERGGLPSSAFVSSGKAFADALVAGPAASLTDGPVLLSSGPTLPAVTAAYLDSLAGGVDLFAIGGAGAASISADPRTEVVGGATRYDVAGNVAQRFFAGWQVLALADGRNWPDAASGGALMAYWQQPVLLTNGTTTLPDRHP